MVSNIPLALQTVYAELLDQCTAAAFDESFQERGTFIVKTVRGRRYWYFQTSTSGEQKQRYVGPETPELLDRIVHHRQGSQNQRQRRALVSTLIRSAHLPVPTPAIGEVLSALARAGVFRLRGVLVGTLAFQTYGAMLGMRLPRAATRTQDIDIAQFRDISVAVEDTVERLLDVLRKADPTFRAVPPPPRSTAVTSYSNATRDVRVDFLTPKLESQTDAPARLPALGTHAMQLRFLDFLIHDPEPAIVLYGAGVLVQVPAPQRYALHKLIVARRRSASSAKTGKDLQQAEALLAVLARNRPDILRDAWNEIIGRGPKWRQLLLEGLGLIAPHVRDEALRLAGLRRRSVPGSDLRFPHEVSSYHIATDTVRFVGRVGRHTVQCFIDGQALARLDAKAGRTVKARLGAFRVNARKIERMARAKYLDWPIEESEKISISARDIDALISASSNT